MITLDDVRVALQLLDFDAQAAQALMSPVSRRMSPPEGTQPREAGVLVLLYPEADGLHIVLTRRTDTLRGHSGQVSFPGGSRDPEDTSLTETALRETCEELGLCGDDIEIIGTLSTLYIPPSNFEVMPTVGALAVPPVFQPNRDEVAEVFTLPLIALLDDRLKESEMRQLQNVDMRVPFYRVRGHQVWGATAIMLSELEGRLRAVVASERIAALMNQPDMAETGLNSTSTTTG